MEIRSHLGWLSFALTCAAFFTQVACEEQRGQFVPNNPPGVKLTATPPDSGTAGYEIEFCWEGWDADGEVDHFIYSIDPPDMYGSEDSVWTRTDAYCGSFLFDATDYDTLYDWRQPQIAKSWHVFAIKAVDDMGAVSDPDYVAFNAATIAPRSQFTTPPPVGGVEQYMGAPQEVGLRVTFRWEGDDLDGLWNETPVKYFFKTVDVCGARMYEVADRVRADTTAWIECGQDERKAVVEFDDGHNYAVAVRAVDEAGAVEPLLLVNGNVLWVGARRMESYPRLTVRSTAFGERTWQGWSVDLEEYEVPLGSRIEFTAVGDAGWYGGLVTGYSYGWDLPQLDSEETDPEGRGAWTPWSTSQTVIVGEFTEPRDYFLHVKCKDDAGNMTLASMRFNVVQLNPTKNLCYMDDWRKYPKNSPSGEPMDDQVWQAMLDGYNYGLDWSEVSWDEWDALYLEKIPSLEFLSQFKVLVWSVNDQRSQLVSNPSTWFRMNKVNTLNVLAVYMTSRTESGGRGKVWAFGKGIVESSLLAKLGWLCEPSYPVDEDGSLDSPCVIEKYSFANEFMHIRGEFDESDPSSGGARISFFRDRPDRIHQVFVDTAGPAIPRELYTRPPAAELYPNLPPVLKRHPDWVSRGWGLRYFEVLEYPDPSQERQDIFYDPEKGRMTGLIPLYLTQAYDSHSPAHKKYCGFRFIPSDPSDPCEFVYFLFPMFPFKDDLIRETAKVILSDWFGLPDPDAPGAGEPGAPVGELESGRGPRPQRVGGTPRERLRRGRARGVAGDRGGP